MSDSIKTLILQYRKVAPTAGFLIPASLQSSADVVAGIP
jgi:hypothetical protein